MHRHRPTPPTPPPSRSFVGWVPYLAAIDDDHPLTVWTTPEEAEEALEAEYGVVPMAEFFDFGESTAYENAEPDDDEGDGGASVLRVLR